MGLDNYVCPITGGRLIAVNEGLRRDDGTLYPFLDVQCRHAPIPNFLDLRQLGSAAQRSLDMYDVERSSVIYRNFLDWLFATVGEDETLVRRSMLARLDLAPGKRVLVTGCGLGEDLPLVLDAIGDSGVVYAQDLSREMVAFSCLRLAADAGGATPANLFFSVSDACHLPFEDRFFDAAFHFGGINLFDDVEGAIGEMNRVVKPGGRVVFGDEGIGPWLRDTEFGRIVVNNNPLWGRSAPLEQLPPSCVDVNVSWILANCFWLIAFTVSEDGPRVDMDVPHAGRRGGTMRTRYFGQLEAITEEAKLLAERAAERRGVSLHQWLDQVVRRAAVDQD